MKFPQKKLHQFAAVVSITAVMFSCQKEFNNESGSSLAVAQTADEMVALTPDQLLQSRALAANCFQCHGTNGYAEELGIAGMDAAELTRKFKEFQADGARENIMNVHALAYTDEQIQLLGYFFSHQ